MAKTLTAKQVDKEIARIFSVRCNRVQINIMDIPTIYRAARAAYFGGGDMEAVIVATVETLRQN